MAWLQTTLGPGLPFQPTANPLYLGGGGKDGVRRADGTVHVVMPVGQTGLQEINFIARGQSATAPVVEEITVYSSPLQPASVSFGVRDTGELLMSASRRSPFSISPWLKNGVGDWVAGTVVNPSGGDAVPYHSLGHQIFCSPGGIIYLIFQRPTNASADSIAYVTSSDGMATWSAETSISDVSGAPCEFAQADPISFEGSMAAYRQPGGLIVVCWAMTAADGLKLFRSVQDGLETGFTLGIEEIADGQPRIAHLDGCADVDGIEHLVAVEGEERSRIVYWRRESGGAWSREVIEEWSGALYHRPRIGMLADGEPFVMCARHQTQPPDTWYRMSFHWRMGGGGWNRQDVAATANLRDFWPVNLYEAYQPDGSSDWRSCSPTRYGIGCYGAHSASAPGLTYVMHPGATWFDSPAGAVTLGLGVDMGFAGLHLAKQAGVVLRLTATGAEVADLGLSAEVDLGLGAETASVTPASLGPSLGLSAAAAHAILRPGVAAATLGLTGDGEATKIAPAAASATLGLSGISWTVYHAGVTLGLEAVILEIAPATAGAAATLGLSVYAGGHVADDQCWQGYTGQALEDPDNVTYVDLWAPATAPSYSISLPKPDFGDVRAVGLNDAATMTEDGSYVVYRRTPHPTTITLTWSMLTRKQVLELVAFLRDSAGETVRFRDHHLVLWDVRVLSRPHELVESLTERGGSVTLDLEGTKVV